MAVSTLLMITACVQDIEMSVKSFASSDPVKVSDEALVSVNRTFYNDFSLGDWFYQGAKVENGEIQAYIKIPQKLKMDEDQQTKYLREAICPQADKKDMWKKLKRTTLTIHIYSYSKDKTFSAQCINPFLPA